MTTNDLNGLWDIITIQLEQIGGNFEKLEKLSKCDWKVETVENLGGVVGKSFEKNQISQKYFYKHAP